MKINKLTLNSPQYPDKLKEIPNPPKNLYVLCENFEKLIALPSVSIVGSRKVTPYGKQVTRTLASDLAKNGVLVISGLALGVDGIALQAAVDNHSPAIAVMPCGLDRIYPASNRSIALNILKNSGALISEYPEGTDPRKENFIARNRIVSGMADGLLITESAEKSGTLHTANFALEQGREVFAVPGNITSQFSKGTNNLIKAGATPVTEAKDILNSLGYVINTESQRELFADTPEELLILRLIQEGKEATNDILEASQLDANTFNQALTMLENKRAHQALRRQMDANVISLPLREQLRDTFLC